MQENASGVNIPRIMTAALRGRSGKTVITLGLLRAFTRQGLVVQAYKKGPDFIDPGWHKAAGSRVSRNLDSFFMTPEQIRGVVHQTSEASNLSIIEGAMGLFDGMDLAGSSSSAEIAKITKTPVLLVIDTTRMTRTAAALVLGCQLFDPAVQIAGVILNRVRGKRHEALIRESIETTCTIPVVGAIPVDARLSIPDRHLGLVSSTESPSMEQGQLLDAIADTIEKYVDLDAVLTLAQQAQPLEYASGKSSSTQTGHQDASRPRIAVVRDKAFCFYYPENLEALEAAGAELVYCNSLEDASLPQAIHALYIGGGFPEVFARELEANGSFCASVKNLIEADLPVYAECGGLMYLGRSLEFEGAVTNMVGALPFDTVMQESRQAHGYSVLEATDGSGLGLTGHEFHHSKVVNLDPALKLLFANTRGTGIRDKQDGLCYKNVLATYTHVNAYASPQWAEQFVKQARLHQKYLDDARIVGCTT